MERVQEADSEQKENKWTGLRFHHTRAIEYCANSLVFPYTPDNLYEAENKWLEREVGFYPIFLAVGDTEMDIRMTGYENQFARKIGTEKYRQKGDLPNDVMFSYKDLSQGVFLDYQAWFLVLNGSHRNYQLTETERRSLFKKSFSKANWLRYAKEKTHSVMYVAPSLDLNKANHISVRNAQTKHQLEKLGFRKNVKVNIHIFSRNKIDLNLFTNIANGIVLDGLLEVHP